MREIKFRAWDKQDHKLRSVATLDLSGSQRKVLMFGGKMRWSKNIELMQYTGLLDKNGKEIYEGDIVRYDDGEEYFDYFVRFKECAYWLMEMSGPSTCGRLKPEDRQQLEIIGNIYENSELLK